MSLTDFEDETAPQDQQEDLVDLELKDDWYSGPSLWSTDWTTETIVAQLRRGNINLNPRFQRRNAWSPQRKSLFIESLLLGLPVPQLVLAEEKGKKGSFIVIDGKQRLLTLRQFSAHTEGDDFRQLRLTGLSDRPDLNGITYDSLKENDGLANDLNVFDNQTIRTVVIRAWKDERYLYSVFLRINTGSVQLSPQELRQALHPGPFSDFIDDVSVDRPGVRNLLKLREADFRMRDVELVLRYFSYRNFGGEYDGNLKRFLDRATETLNATWVAREAELRSQADQLDAALEAARAIFSERDEIRKWNGNSFEKRINRAVFDIIVFSLSSPALREAALAHGPALKEAFQNLCTSDREFLSAVEQTTKSREANKTRFNTWAQTFEKVTGASFQSPFA